MILRYLALLNCFIYWGRGINIEPLRSKCLLLEEQRPKDINLCIGIGDKIEKRMFTAGGSGSTFSEKVKQNDYLIGKASFEKAIIRLTDVYRRYCQRNQEINFCKVDVEGYEKNVLLGIEDRTEFRPWIYVIESKYPNTNISVHDEWEDILLQHDYLFTLAWGV